MPRSEGALEALAEDFAAGFREAAGPIRRVGLEAEYPLVTERGTAGDLRRLWPVLLQDSTLTPEYEDPKARSLVIAARRPGLSLSAEVGLGTIELSLGPCEDLWGLQSALQGALGKAVAVARGEGMSLLGFGIQPRTSATPRLMTPRRHYQAMLRAAGKPWLPLTTTASSQLHVDIQRAEVVPAVNAMNLVSGPLIALAANSPIYAGRAGSALSGREALLAGLGEHRYGMTPRAMTDLLDLVTYLAGYRCYVLRQGARFVPTRSSFQAWLARADLQPRAKRFEQFLWHEHYVWNSARARFDHSTVEIRPACQQPPGSPLAVHALNLGWVESIPDLLAYFSDSLGPDPWPAMIRYRRASIREGMHAEPPVPNMLAELLEVARRGLARRGRKEESLLDPIAARLEQGDNPADRARQLFRARGMAALLDSVRIQA